MRGVIAFAVSAGAIMGAAFSPAAAGAATVTQARP